MPYTTEYLKKFGFSPAQLPPGLSLALGTALVTPLQMAQAYAVFANGGMRVVPYAISTIYNSHDQLIYQAKPLIACQKNCDPDAALAPRVLTEQTAYLVTSALRDVIEHGTAKAAQSVGRSDIAGKTGTTQNQVDAWFAGYNKSIVAISWMGFDLPQSLHEYGAQAALPGWSAFMSMALKNTPDRGIEQPAGIVSMRINPYSGTVASASESDAIFEFFMPPYLPDKTRENPAAAAARNFAAKQAEAEKGNDDGINTPELNAAEVPKTDPLKTISQDDNAADNNNADSNTNTDNNSDNSAGNNNSDNNGNNADNSGDTTPSDESI
jgi:penicillin-binding protein 1A